MIGHFQYFYKIHTQIGKHIYTIEIQVTFKCFNKVFISKVDNQFNRDYNTLNTLISLSNPKLNYTLCISLAYTFT